MRTTGPMANSFVQILFQIRSKCFTKTFKYFCYHIHTNKLLISECYYNALWMFCYFFLFVDILIIKLDNDSIKYWCATVIITYMSKVNNCLTIAYNAHTISQLDFCKNFLVNKILVYNLRYWSNFFLNLLNLAYIMSFSQNTLIFTF